jgi:hypothetical protein
MATTINPFNDVADVSIQPSSNMYGQDVLNNLASLKIGQGAKAFKADESGIWLGGNKFADAPFSVDINGNIIATSLDLSSYLSKTGTNQPMSGTIRLGTGSGAASIFLDGPNKRIIINDGTYDRVLLGYQSGGF